MLISVIVPIFNLQKYLFSCLESIKRQTFGNFEVIMVDDGSTDESATICKEFCQEDIRFHYYYQDNAGVSVARNNGIKHARGDYLAFVDGDDVIHQDYFNILASMSSTFEADLCVCGSQRFSDNFDVESKIKNASEAVYPGRDALIKMLYADGLDDAPWGMIVERATWGSAKFPSGLQYEDLYLMPTIYAKAHNVAISKCDLYGYRQRRGSAMHAETPSEKRLADYELAISHLFITPELESLESDHVLKARDARACLESLRLRRLLLHLNTQSAKTMKARIDKQLKDLMFNIYMDSNCPKRLKLKCTILRIAPRLSEVISKCLVE